MQRHKLDRVTFDLLHLIHGPGTMKLASAFVALAFAAFATSVEAVNTTSGVPVYTASKSFPTGVFPSMYYLSLIHISEPTRRLSRSRMPSSA